MLPFFFIVLAWAMNQMYPKTVACWLKKIYDELHLHGCTWTSPGDRQLKFCHYASATIVLCKLNGKHRIRVRPGRLGSGSLNMWWLWRPNELAPASLSNRNKLNQHRLFGPRKLNYRNETGLTELGLKRTVPSLWRRPTGPHSVPLAFI
jgi:hypothetical protein